MWDMEDKHVCVYEHLRNVTTLKRCPQVSDRVTADPSALLQRATLGDPLFRERQACRFLQGYVGGV